MRPSQKVKYVVVSNEVVALVQGDDLFYRDEYGTIWAEKNDAASLDPEVRAGIGIFSIDGYSAQVQYHDFAYSSDVYQAFKTRKEADEALFQHMKGSWLRRPFYYISRVFGFFFWENKKTNL